MPSCAHADSAFAVPQLGQEPTGTTLQKFCRYTSTALEVMHVLSVVSHENSQQICSSGAKLARAERRWDPSAV